MSKILEYVKRVDSWVNTLTGVGTSLDKTLASRYFGAYTIPDQELTNLYVSNDMAARIVDHLPEDCFREGYDLRCENVDEDTARARFEDLEINAKLQEAMTWGRLYGGAITFLIVTEKVPAPWDSPLDPLNVTGLQALEVIDKRYCQPASYYAAGPKATYPETYRISRGTQQVLVHETRVIKFLGDSVDYQTLIQQNFWGLSVLQRRYEALRMFDSNWHSLEHMLTEGSNAVFKLKGLLQLIAEGQEAAVQRRLQLINMSRSAVRATALDADEESFEKIGTSVEGVAAALDRTAQRLAASVPMPVTILMGMSPAGLNATGQSDLQWYYDRVRAEQEKTLDPIIRRIFALAYPGQRCTVEFRSLNRMTPLQQAELENKQASTDVLYVQNGVYSESEVALSRFSEDGWRSGMSAFDPKTRAAGAPEPLTEPMPVVDPLIETTDDEEPRDAIALAQQMTDLQLTQCEHGRSNRCPLCGVERLRSPALDKKGKPMRDKAGKTLWTVAWKAYGTQATPDEE